MPTQSASSQRGRAVSHAGKPTITRSGLHGKITDVKSGLEKFAKLLTSQYGLRIIFRGTECHTNGKTIVLPELGLLERKNMSEAELHESLEFLTSIRGFVNHEASHILFTDMKVLPNAHKEDGNKKMFLLNALEDLRCERKMGELYKGASQTLRHLAEWADGKIAAGIAAKKARGEEMDRFAQLMYGITMVGNKSGSWANPEDAKTWQHIDDDLKKLCLKFQKKIRSARMKDNTKDLLKLTDEIWEEMKHEYQEPPQQPQQQGKQGQQGGQGKGKQGKGKGGKGQSQQSSKDDGGSGGESDTSDDQAGGQSGRPGGGSQRASGKNQADSRSQRGQQPQGGGNASSGDGEDESGGSPESPSSEVDEQEDQDDAGGAGGDQEGDEDPEESSDDGDAGQPQDGDGESEEDPGDEDGDQSGEGDGEAGDDSEDDEEQDASDGSGDESSLDEQEEPEGEAQQAGADKHSFRGDDLFDERKKVSGSEAPDGTEKQLQDFMKKVMPQALRDLDGQYLVYTTESDRRVRIEVPKGKIEVWDGNYSSGPERIDPKAYVQKIADQVRSSHGVLKRTLEAKLRSRALSYRVGGLTEGRLDRSALHRLPLDLGNNIFAQEVKAPTLKDTTVGLIYDCSGSMQSRLNGLHQALYVFAEVLDLIQVPFMSWGFTTGDHEGYDRFCKATPDEREMFTRFGAVNIHVLKDFEEHWRAVRPRLAGVNAYNNAYDGECLRIAAQELISRPEKRKFLFCFCDGEPCGNEGGYKNDRLASYLKTVATELTDNKRVSLIGVGIGTDAPKKYYPKAFTINDMKDLPALVLKELGQILI